jgi:hypothetical protein
MTDELQSRPAQGSGIEAGIEARCEGRSEIPPHGRAAGKLGLSPDGLSQGEAPKRLTQYGPNEIKENQSVREMPHLFLGSHPVDDRSSRDPFDGSPALAGFLHHPNLHQEDTSDSFIDGHILPLAPKLGTERLGVTDCAD